MKRTLFAAAFSFMAAAAFPFEIEKPFFSGTTGFFTLMEKKESRSDVKANAESYFAGQLDFSGTLFFRGEFYTISDGIFEDEISDENAFFRVEEICATYKKTGDSSSHYFSIFKGNHEPFGSDIFLKRHFGISRINSNLTESHHGIEGASMTPLYATGFSYTLHTDENKALAFSFYKNGSHQDLDDSDDTICLDGRYAGVSEHATFDIIAGFSLPTNSDDGSVLSIKEIQFHAGINALFGKKKSMMLYTQLGIDKIYVKKGDSSSGKVNLKNYYILVEPRIPISDFYFNPSVFNFPKRTASDMIYLRQAIYRHPGSENILGVNFNIVNENLYSGSSRITVGIHGTFAVTELDNDKATDNLSSAMSEASKTFIITPYAEMEVFGGSISAFLSADFKELMDSPSNSISASIGFKTSF